MGTIEIGTAKHNRQKGRIGPGTYDFVPNTGDTPGGSFVEQAAQPLEYFYLIVNGAELGGVYVDREIIERDAANLRKVLNV